MLWRTTPGIRNPAGNLALHIEGNLGEYIGRQLGKLAFQRERDREFALKGMTREELATRVAELRQSIPSIVAELSPEQVEHEYPEVVLEKAHSTQAFLIHLYGHLNWHLGQIDSLRRAFSGDGATERAGLQPRAVRPYGDWPIGFGTAKPGD